MVAKRKEPTSRKITSLTMRHPMTAKRPKSRIKNSQTGELEDDNSDNPRAWDVCVTTYEVCNTERQVLSKFARKYLVIDEAHRLKNEASIFSKTVRTFSTFHLDSSSLEHLIKTTCTNYGHCLISSCPTYSHHQTNSTSGSILRLGMPTQSRI